MESSSFQRGVRYLFFIVAVGVVIFAGYEGFLYFATQVMGNTGLFSLGVVAVIAGIAVFFSPCSFPFIPIYLTKYSEMVDSSSNHTPFILGIFASLGLLTFNLLLGILIGFLGVGFGRSLSISSQHPLELIRWVRGAVGLFLVFAGISHLTGRGLRFSSSVSASRVMKQHNRPLLNMYLYGFLYTLIGIGCAGPVLAGLSVLAFSTGGFSLALSGFTIYSLVMVALMLFISLLVSASQKKTLSKLHTSTGMIKKIAGGIMIVIGLFFIWSAVFLHSFVQLLFP